MTLSKGKFLVINENNHGFFIDLANGQKKLIVFRFEKYPSKQLEKGKIVQMLMHEIYVIVVFETAVAIFNAQTGDFLEEHVITDRLKYRAACLNHQTGDTMLLAYNTSKASNII